MGAATGHASHGGMQVRVPTGALAMAVIMGGLAVGAWWWRSSVVNSEGIGVPAQIWEHVRERFPEPGELPEVPSLPAEALQPFIDANPFSATRRYVPPPPIEPGQAQVEEPDPISLKYKGRVQLGSLQRAIIETRPEGKTHFLEVGQEVAGYKVLDITEDQVLLSDLQSNEEVALFLNAKEAQ